MKKLLALAAAVCMLLLGGVRVSAQQTLTLPAGGFYQLGARQFFSKVGPFQAMAVTLAPKGVTLYLDAAPLEIGRVLTPEQAKHIWVFVPQNAAPASLGLTLLGQRTQSGDPPLRIRAVNPVFNKTSG